MANDAQVLQHRLIGCNDFSITGGGANATQLQQIQNVTFGTDIVIDSFTVEYALSVNNVGAGALSLDTFGMQVVESINVPLILPPTATRLLDSQSVWWNRNDHLFVTVAPSTQQVQSRAFLRMPEKILRQGTPISIFAKNPGAATTTAIYDLSFIINYWTLSAYKFNLKYRQEILFSK